MEFERFGVMLDVSRNAVMKIEEIEKFVDIISKMGYNALELYSEDMYEVKEEPYLGYLRGRYSSSEIKKLDKICQKKGVELIPCIQTLAHFTNSVKLPRFNEITDINDILLIGNDETYKFIDRIFKFCSDNFKSRQINIGMDEAHMVGLGRYLSEHGYTDRIELLLKHLKKVMTIASKYGFKPHMWSDMFIRLINSGEYYGLNNLGKEQLDKISKIKRSIPKDLSLCYWDYYQNDKKIYDNNFNLHTKLSKDIWFAGGAWTWNGFAPLNDFSLLTMLPAMQSAREYKIKNVLITMWGDDGHECSNYSVLPSLFAIRKFADGVYDLKEIEREFNDKFNLSFNAFMSLDIANFSKSYPNKKSPSTACKSLLYNDCFLGVFDKVVKNEGKILYGEYAKELSIKKRKAGEFSYIFDTQIKLCKVLELKYDLGIKTRNAYKKKDKNGLSEISNIYGELLKRLNKFYDAFSYQWHKENKSFGFEVQSVRIGGLKQRIYDCKVIIDKFVSGEINKIPELDEDVLLLSNGQNLQLNLYRRMISTSEL